MTGTPGASRGVQGDLLAAGAQGDEGTSKDTGKSYDKELEIYCDQN